MSQKKNEYVFKPKEDVIFGRVSLAQLLEYQEQLLDYITNAKKIDRITFAKLYNKSTLGLARDADRVIRKMIFYGKFDKKILLATLPLIFNKVISRAIRFRSEITTLGTRKVVMKI